MQYCSQSSTAGWCPESSALFWYESIKQMYILYTYIYISHLSYIFLRQKRLRATCETWPHKRKIFHLKSKRRPKSCKMPPTKCCSHHHSQGPPQGSICAAAKGPQVSSRNLQHPRNALSQQRRLQPGLSGVCSPAQGSWAVTEQSPGRIPKPPSLELGWVTGPYFQSLQKNLHMKLLDGSSLPHLNCFHFFINQLVKET